MLNILIIFSNIYSFIQELSVLCWPSTFMPLIQWIAMSPKIQMLIYSTALRKWNLSLRLMIIRMYRSSNSFLSRALLLYPLSCTLLIQLTYLFNFLLIKFVKESLITTIFKVHSFNIGGCKYESMKNFG